MECLAVCIVIFFLTAVLPLGRMIFGKGPNNWRKLVRIDLAAFLVFTTGVAGALAVVRDMDWVSAAILLTFALPASIALAWLGRFALEELAAYRRKSFHESREPVDLSYLANDSRSAVREPMPADSDATDVVVAELVPENAENRDEGSEPQTQ